MPFITTFIVLSALGILDAGYLFYKHIKKEKLVCVLDSDCGAVTESKWSHTFGIRNETLGLLYYIALLAGIISTFFFLPYIKLIQTGLFVVTLGGLLFSIFLVYLQIYVIKNYCFYCMISAFLSLLLFINSIAFFL